MQPVLMSKIFSRGSNAFDHSTAIDNGDRMLNLCSILKLKVLGTCCPHRLIHRTTWYSNVSTISKAIYHILASGRWRVSSNCRVFRSTEFGYTDHRLLVAIFDLRLPPCEHVNDIQQKAHSGHRNSIHPATQLFRLAALEPHKALKMTWNNFVKSS